MPANDTPRRAPRNEQYSEGEEDGSDVSDAESEMSADSSGFILPENLDDLDEEIIQYLFDEQDHDKRMQLLVQENEAFRRQEQEDIHALRKADE